MNEIVFKKIDQWNQELVLRKDKINKSLAKLIKKKKKETEIKTDPQKYKRL